MALSAQAKSILKKERTRLIEKRRLLQSQLRLVNKDLKNVDMVLKTKKKCKQCRRIVSNCICSVDEPKTPADPPNG